MTNNKDYLSQEEIDALLRQSSDDSSDSSFQAPRVEDYLSSLEQDAWVRLVILHLVVLQQLFLLY